MKICDFTKSELIHYRSECNFTKEQLELFNLRADDVPLEKCAEIMDVSLSTVYRINRKIKNKIEKVKIYNYNNNIERCKI